MKKSAFYNIFFLIVLLFSVHPSYGNPQYVIDNRTGEGVWILRQGIKIAADYGMKLDESDSIILCTKDDALIVEDSENNRKYHCPPHKRDAIFSVRQIIDYSESFNEKSVLKNIVMYITSDYHLSRTGIKEPVEAVSYKGESDWLQAIFLKQQLYLVDSLNFAVNWIENGHETSSMEICADSYYCPKIIVSGIFDSSCVLMRISYSDSYDVDWAIVYNGEVCESVIIGGYRIPAISKIELFIGPYLCELEIDLLKAFWQNPNFETSIDEDSALYYLKEIKYIVKYE